MILFFYLNFLFDMVQLVRILVSLRKTSPKAAFWRQAVCVWIRPGCVRICLCTGDRRCAHWRVGACMRAVFHIDFCWYGRLAAATAHARACEVRPRPACLSPIVHAYARECLLHSTNHLIGRAWTSTDAMFASYASLLLMLPPFSEGVMRNPV